MRKFEGKTAVIAGASSGISESCAKKSVAALARVVLGAQSTEPLQWRRSSARTQRMRCQPMRRSSAPAGIFSKKRSRPGLRGRWPQRADQAWVQREALHDGLSVSVAAPHIASGARAQRARGQEEIPRSQRSLINRFRAVEALAPTSVWATGPRYRSAEAFCRGASDTCCAAKYAEAG